MNGFFNRKKWYLVVVFTVSAYIILAQNAARLPVALQNLSVRPVSEKNAVSEACTFILEIPSVKAAEVVASLPDLPDTATFVSMRLFDSVDSKKTTGVVVELHLRFLEPGIYKLSPLSVSISGRTYSIPFEQVAISENPKTISPCLIVDFDNGSSFSSRKEFSQREVKPLSVPQGSALKFTVSIQYAVKLVSIYWAAPKNSIFTELERYEFQRGADAELLFTDEKIPIARFEWRPLVIGETNLPFLKVVAIAYNGAQEELSMPELPFTIVDALPVKEVASSGLAYFSDAFSSLSDPAKDEIKSAPSRRDCEKIAELRAKERRGLPFGKDTDIRKECERSVGIDSAEDEPRYFTRTLFAVLTVIFLVMLFFSIVIKKIPRILPLVFSALAILFFVFFSLSQIRLSTGYGIFTGGGLRTVPEENTSAFVSIESGRRVRIEHKSGAWLFISADASSGWAREDAVVFICDKRE